ncbi:helicase associated domain-containing protein [Longimicrobium sp.]|uniref:helicase associated domain-containing protein n=1 Tax=Longimicrobium sp. TaxID=2029185 RepID=UPI0039C994C8
MHWLRGYYRRIPLPRFRRSVALQALKQAGDPFEYGLERLLVHAEDTGSAAVPVAHVAPDRFALGRWTASVRAAYRQGRLTDERIGRFEALPGWYWGRDDAEWRWGHRALLRHVRRNGHVQVVDGWWSRRDGWLGAWVAQRRGEPGNQFSGALGDAGRHDGRGPR